MNQYELIRKYRCNDCNDCNEVMICDCDEEIGRRFLAHQLDSGTELDTQRPIPVTLEFQPNICPECRGLPPVTAPKAAIYGSSTKIKRYYWREIQFQTMERFANWLDQGGLENSDESFKKRKEIEREVLCDIKKLHATAPRYIYKEISQNEIIKKFHVEVVRLDGVHKRFPDSKRVAIVDGSKKYTPEQFASQYFENSGFRTIFLESSPIHVLFGVFMWLLIHDPYDPLLQVRFFGDRNVVDQGGEAREIWTHLPEDFGTKGYGRRRATEIEKHFTPQMQDREELKWLFEYWLPTSENFRQYLWAHRDEHIIVARTILDILPPATIISILKYLIEDYWGRYCGWPDLLVYKNDEFFFAEVKSSGDRLSEDQKRWVQDNHDNLKLPFKLVKIHKA